MRDKNGCREPIKARLWVTRTGMDALSDRDHAVLRFAVDEGQITVYRTAEQLLLSRAVAGATLRSLERAGHLDGQLVGGGQIGYRPTKHGRARLHEIARQHSL